ncbi:glycosyltransferase [Myxococcota bacterium]|nr:glycosyltransferase [Myxococcota bacterium]
MSPKIVYAYDQPLPNLGADSEQVVNTTAALARTSAEVALWATTLGDDADALKAHYDISGPLTFEALNVGPTAPQLRGIQKLRFARRFAADPRLRAVDWIHTRHLPVLFAALRRDLPVFYETYRPWPTQLPALRPALRRALAHPRLIGLATHSEHAAESFRALGVAPGKISVQHNGFDPRRFQGLSRAEARARLGLPDDKPIACYTGRVDPEKGVGLLLEMARRLPQVRFLIVGSRGPGGPLEREGAALENVIFAPWQAYSATVEYLYAADVLLVPPTGAPLTRHGNTVLPMKLFSYLAAGRVILAPRAPDTRELLNDEDAVLVPPDDVAAATEALRATLAAPARMEALAAAALEVASAYTWDARARRILDLCQAARGA